MAKYLLELSTVEYALAAALPSHLAAGGFLLATWLLNGTAEGTPEEVEKVRLNTYIVNTDWSLFQYFHKPSSELKNSEDVLFSLVDGATLIQR